MKFLIILECFLPVEDCHGLIALLGIPYCFMVQKSLKPEVDENRDNNGLVTTKPAAVSRVDIVNSFILHVQVLKNLFKLKSFSYGIKINLSKAQK